MTKRTIAPLFTWRSAVCESDLSPTTRHIAITLSLYMNERGGSAHPGATLLAHDTGLNVSTIREHLALLASKGWLVLVERGGLKGEKRVANEYEARVPLAMADPSEETTRQSETPDPSSSAGEPLGLADPISSGNSPENSPSGGTGASAPSTNELVAHWVEVFRRKADADPPETWRAAMGAQVKRALKEYPAEDIRKALNACAIEGKHPRALLGVLMDYYRDKKRGVA